MKVYLCFAWDADPEDRTDGHDYVTRVFANQKTAIDWLIDVAHRHGLSATVWRRSPSDKIIAYASSTLASFRVEEWDVDG